MVWGVTGYVELFVIILVSVLQDALIGFFCLKYILKGVVRYYWIQEVFRQDIVKRKRSLENGVFEKEGGK